MQCIVHFQSSGMMYNGGRGYYEPFEFSTYILYHLPAGFGKNQSSQLTIHRTVTSTLWTPGS